MRKTIVKEKEIVPPAIEGVKNILKACLENKVKKFIYCSDIDTCYESKNMSKIDETHWAKPEG
jgi:nucleoside-diphosphate-sugar epimerase